MDALYYMQALGVQFIAFLLILKQNVNLDIVASPPLHTPVAVAGRENAAS